MSNEFLDAFKELQKEKHLSEEEIIGAIKDSLNSSCDNLSLLIDIFVE